MSTLLFPCGKGRSVDSGEAGSAEGSGIPEKTEQCLACSFRITMGSNQASPSGWTPPHRRLLTELFTVSALEKFEMFRELFLGGREYFIDIADKCKCWVSGSLLLWGTSPQDTQTGGVMMVVSDYGSEQPCCQASTPGYHERFKINNCFIGSTSSSSYL